MHGTYHSYLSCLSRAVIFVNCKIVDVSELGEGVVSLYLPYGALKNANCFFRE